MVQNKVGNVVGMLAAVLLLQFSSKFMLLLLVSCLRFVCKYMQ